MDKVCQKEEERIKKDIMLFEESLEGLFSSELMDKEEEMIIDLAKRYYEDTKYYFSRKDFFTAFGCINYAHGLVDGVKIRKSLSLGSGSGLRKK